MAAVNLTEVKRLRELTGAGISDCKKALSEAEGDMDRAIDLIRERGKAIANKRSDREASEGVVLADVTADGRTGILITLNCETDFVAKNADFIGTARAILDEALKEKPADLEALLAMRVGDETAQEKVVQFSAITGEKMELSYFARVDAERVASYIHPGNRLASILGAEGGNPNEEVMRNLVIQVAGMNPLAVDADSMPEEVIRKEKEIGREQAKLEGKPDAILDKIAEGRVAKFLRENSLMSQVCVMSDKQTVEQYMAEVDKDMRVTGFARYALSD